MPTGQTCNARCSYYIILRRQGSRPPGMLLRRAQTLRMTGYVEPIEGGKGMRALFCGLGLVVLAALAVAVRNGVREGRLDSVALPTVGVKGIPIWDGEELSTSVMAASARARDKINGLSDRANLFRKLGSSLDWLAIGIAGVLTLFGGIYGKGRPADKDPTELERLGKSLIEAGRHQRRFAVIVGCLASSSAVAGLVGSEFNSQEAGLRQSAKELHARYRKATGQLLGTKDTAQVHSVLKELEQIELE